MESFSVQAFGKMSLISLQEKCSTFIIAFRVLGLGPAASQRTEDICVKVHSLIVFTIIALVSYSGLSSNDPQQNHSLETSLNRFYKASVLLTHLIIIVNAICRRRSQLNILEVCTSVDGQLCDKFNVNIDYSRWNRNLLLNFCAKFTVITASQIYFIQYFIRNERYENFFYYCYYSMMMERFHLAQVEFYVILMEARLAIVEQQLRCIAMHYRDNFHMDHLRRVRKDSNCPTTFGYLLNLKEIYGALNEMGNLVNDTFGWALLAVISQYFIQFTSETYGLFMTLVRGDIGSILFYWYICQLISVIVVLMSLSYTCYSYSKKVCFVPDIHEHIQY